MKGIIDIEERVRALEFSTISTSIHNCLITLSTNLIDYRSGHRTGQVKSWNAAVIRQVKEDGKRGGFMISPHLQYWDPRLYQAATDTPPVRSSASLPCVEEPYVRTTNTTRSL